MNVGSVSSNIKQHCCWWDFEDAQEAQTAVAQALTVLKDHFSCQGNSSPRSFAFHTALIPTDSEDLMVFWALMRPEVGFSRRDQVGCKASLPGKVASIADLIITLKLRIVWGDSASAFSNSVDSCDACFPVRRVRPTRAAGVAQVGRLHL